MTKWDLSQEHKVFQQWKSIHVTQYINKMKKKDNCIVFQLNSELVGNTKKIQWEKSKR